MYCIDLQTDRNGLFEISGEVEKAVKASGVGSGAAIIWVPHTTAGVTVISKMDELGFEDIVDEINRLIPTRVDFKHQFDTPTDASGHIKSALVGVSVSAIIENGTLQVGSSQGIYFFEFDGPRKRKFYVQVLSSCGNAHEQGGHYGD